jgi:hypothetical protein
LKALKTSLLLTSVVILTVLSPGPVCALTLIEKPDSKIGFNARTYPIGAQAVGSVGGDALLWGNSSNWQYGYARLATNLATSAVVNRVGFEAQVFPISILGFSAGYDWGFRNYIPKYLDCTRYECEGRIDRKYLKANLVMAAGDFIFVGLAKYESLRGVGTTKPFFDENTLLIGQNQGERIFTLNPILLYSIDPAFKVGAMSLYSHAIDTGDYSHLYGAIVSWSKTTQLNAAGGVGLNRSPVVQSGWCAFLSVQYTFASSLSITDMAMRNEQNHDGI